MSQTKVGLVLSGGGAKGAYQAGVIKALHEMGARVDAVAGASIGALNGAVIATAPSLEVAASRLEELWIELAEGSPLKLHLPAVLGLLAASGLSITGLDTLNQALKKAAALTSMMAPELMRRISWLAPLGQGIFSDVPLRCKLDQYLNQNALVNGLPLYISVYKSGGTAADLLAYAAAELGLVDSKESTFLHVQSLPTGEQKDALLASAAIPLLFAPRKIDDSLYCDGGLGGWQKMQGNTPITPLLKAGCSHIIVTHLCDGSLWSRNDFPDATILEIRPQSQLCTSVTDLLGFDREKIRHWMSAGYHDTLHCCGRIKRGLEAQASLVASQLAVSNAHDEGTLLDKDLHDAMERLK